MLLLLFGKTKDPSPQQDLVPNHGGKDPLHCGSDRIFLAVGSGKPTQIKLNHKHTYMLS